MQSVFCVPGKIKLFLTRIFKLSWALCYLEGVNKVLVRAQHGEASAHSAYKPLSVFTKAMQAPQGWSLWGLEGCPGVLKRHMAC